MADNRITGHLLEIELQTTRQDSDRYFLWIGRCQNKLDMRRGFFEGFKHRVERVPGQHVHLVNHVDLEATDAGRIDSLFKQLRHLFNAAI